MSTNSANRPMASIESEYYAYLLGADPATNTSLNDIEEEILNGINMLLSSAQDTCNSLPRLPDVLPKLMMALRDERASWKGIANIIAQDALLVAEVLRLANSPVFRAAMKVNSLEQIVMQLGMVGLREVVITVSLKPIMKFEGGHNDQHLGRNIWAQAQSAAVACRSLARALLPGCRFEAYLAGLVHNIGMVVVARNLQKNLRQDTHAPNSLLFRNQIQDAVKRLSFMVAKHWELPDLTLAALKEQIAPADALESPLSDILQRGIALSRLSELQHERIIDDADARLEALPEDEQKTSQQAFGQITTQTQP